MDNGDRVEDQEGMCSVVSDYFTLLFTGEVEEGSLSQDRGIRTISLEQNVKLTEDFSFEEFTTAVKQMHPDKSAGPNVLNPALFQKFWSIMGLEIYEYCKSWLSSAELPGELSCTNVVLIPKKKNATSMKDL